MLWTNENWKKLEIEPLKYRDCVDFRLANGSIYHYNVRINYLGVNDQFILETAIFEYLHIEDIKSFCAKQYGYPAVSNTLNNIWAECHSEDWKALTRCVMELFRLLEEKETPVKKLLLESINYEIHK